MLDWNRRIGGVCVWRFVAYFSFREAYFFEMCVGITTFKAFVFCGTYSVMRECIRLGYFFIFHRGTLAAPRVCTYMFTLYERPQAYPDDIPYAKLSSTNCSLSLYIKYIRYILYIYKSYKKDIYNIYTYIYGCWSEKQKGNVTNCACVHYRVYRRLYP